LSNLSCWGADWCVATGGYVASGNDAGPDPLVETLAAGNWTVAEAPLPSNASSSSQETFLEAPVCSSEDECIAVGEYSDANGNSQGLIEALSGGTWTSSEAPVPADASSSNQDADLTGLACSAAGSCIAVGSYNDINGNEQGLIETLSGGSWTASEAPAPASTWSNPYIGLQSPVCATAGSCTAVGEYTDASGETEGLIETLSDGTWTPIEAPLPANASYDSNGAGLATLACPAATWCIAVGSYSDLNNNTQGLIETLSGGTWTASEAPQPANAATSDQYTALYSSTCAAVGSCVTTGFYNYNNGNDDGLIETLSGGVWTPTETPLPPNASTGNQSPFLYSLSCPAASSCTGVGTYTDNNGDSQGLIETLSGATWTPAEAPLPANDADNTYASLSGVTCPAGGSCMAVGSYVVGDDGQPLIETEAALTPTVTNVSPNGGLDAGGTLATITGENFYSVESVTFGGTGASFVVNSPTSITATSPAGSGTADVVVTTASGSSPVTADDEFNYLTASGTFAASFGESFKGQVVELTGVPESVSDLSGTIAWGDGTTSVAALSSPSADTVEVAVEEPHSYWVAGNANVVITLSDSATGASQVASFTEPVDSTYVLMGDSYSSGEGGTFGDSAPGTSNAIYQNPAGSPVNTDSCAKAQYLENKCAVETDSSTNVCHRSLESVGELFYKQVLQQDDVTTFKDVACSGAVLQDFYYPADSDRRSSGAGDFNNTCKLVWHKPQPTKPSCQTHSGTLADQYDGQGPQLAALSPNDSVITLGIGGNDLAFAGILQDCIEATNPACIDNDKTKAAKVESLLEPYLVNLYRTIRALAPGARILVEGYPLFFPPNGGSDGNDCNGTSGVVHMNEAERLWINAGIADANRMIETAVNQSGVAEYVDISDAFSGHELCSSPKSSQWDMNGLKLFVDPNSVKPLPSQESFHPNPDGHQAELPDVASEYESGANLGEQLGVSTVAPGQCEELTFTVPPVSEANAAGFYGFSIWAESTTEANPSLALYDPTGSPTCDDPTGNAGGSQITSGKRAFFVVQQPWTGGTWTLVVTNPSSSSSSAVIDTGLSPFGYQVGPSVSISATCGRAGASNGILKATGQVTAANSPPISNGIGSYEWTLYEQPDDAVVTTSSSALSFTDTGLRGVYDVVLSATDAQGDTGYADTELKCGPNGSK